MDRNLVDPDSLFRRNGSRMYHRRSNDEHNGRLISSASPASNTSPGYQDPNSIFSDQELGLDEFSALNSRPSIRTRASTSSQRRDVQRISAASEPAPGYGESTTQQPMWALYPDNGSIRDSGLPDSRQFPINQVNDQRIGNSLSGGSAMTGDEFLSFASETQQQQRSLMQQQQQQQHQQQQQQQQQANGRPSRGSYEDELIFQPVQTSSAAQFERGRTRTSVLQEQDRQMQLKRAPSFPRTMHGTALDSNTPTNVIRQPATVPVSRSTSVDSRNYVRGGRLVNSNGAGASRQSRVRKTQRGSESAPHHPVSDYDASSDDFEVEDPVMVRRRKFKPKSSIPPDLSSSNYAEQCTAAAVSSRLPPFRLHNDEYNILRPVLSYVHVTTYLNIRNGILRLWLSNPIVNVTLTEAAGCVRDERFYGLAEFAYEWLVRSGYINFGCVEYPLHKRIDAELGERLKPRQTILIVGAGISGLGCARQLDNLLNRYGAKFDDYEDIPRIVVLEGRRRIGGRIYSAPLKSDHNCLVDLGAHIIMGYGDGNPLGVLVRRQLGLPIVPMEPPSGIYDGVTRQPVSPDTEYRAHQLFRHLLRKMSEFKNAMPEPITTQGDEVLMKAAKDPIVRDEFQESQTIAKVEESGDIPKPYEDPGELEEQSVGNSDELETIEEVKFLRSIGISTQKTARRPIHVAPEPQGELYPSLGHTMKGLLRQLVDMAQLSTEDVRILNWYIANLEYSTGCNLDDLSLACWNQDEGHDFSGRHSAISNGYMSLLRGLYIYPEKLDVRFKTSVKVIEYHDDYSDIFLENGERIKADCVILTAPLGVLKERSIQFIPDLPQWKTDSIERLGYGVMNKVCLVFDNEFWDESRDIFCVARGPDSYSIVSQRDYENVRGEFFMFWNCTKAVGKPCLVGLLTGDAAAHISNESDEVVVERAQAALAEAIPTDFNKPYQLVESVVTRWQIDPFSRGSYSYVGREATGADYDLMARPIGRSVFFAGEATCRAFPGTVHGAYLSGLRAAHEVLTSFIGDIEMPDQLIPSKDAMAATRSHYATAASSQMSSNIVTPNIVASNNPSPLGPQYPMAMEVQPIPEQVPGYSFGDAEEVSRKRHQSTVEALEARLRELREDRVHHDNERMRNDLIKELGERPVKPERSGANPFLIFQKDFWEQCRQETDEAKHVETGDPNARASRNEVRAALGKMWREFPEDQKQPYLEKTKDIKEENNKKNDDFRKRLKQYDSEAEDFRRRWKEDNATKPTDEEHQLARQIQELSDSGHPKTKRRLK